MIPRLLVQRLALAAACVALGTLAACSEQFVSAPSVQSQNPDQPSANVLTALTCTAQVSSGRVTCGAPTADGSVSRDIFGGQGTYVNLTSSNVSYNGGTGIFQFDVTVQNLMNEAIGTPDGVMLNPTGIRVFFSAGPTVTGGTGVMSVANADGTGTFTSTNQPYFQYSQILTQNQVSASKTWQLNMPNTVTSFVFTVYVETAVQPLIVINELMANTNPSIPDTDGEWVELYNAGSRAVNLQNYVFTDATNPYFTISSSLPVAAGGYVVLGRNANSGTNGGATVDYSYGIAIGFSNAADGFKIARVVGTDTLLIDQVAYTSGAISAKEGISRELTNPLLDNSNVDGSNWKDAAVAAVYGPAGRGTPKAQNSP